MPINYPNGTDEYTVPTRPENTPTSQAGGGTRNLYESVRDEGAGITALQRNAAKKGHDHSGDANDVSKGPKLAQANTHENPDTNQSNASLHHTLDPLQVNPLAAATATHGHSYNDPRITNTPYRICTSTSRPLDPFPGLRIWEKDTHCSRVWDQFPSQQQAVQGLYSTDNFTRTSTTDPGPDWSVTYVNGATGHGKVATPSGNSLSWAPQGNTYNRAILRRIKASDAHTQTFDQVITFNTNDHVANWENANATNPLSNDVYFRMSDDGKSYVRAALTWYKGSSGSIVLVHTNSGPTGEQFIGQLSAQTNTANIDWQLKLVGNKFSASMGIQDAGSLVDNTGALAKNNTGWGIGMQAGDGGLGQSIPNEIDFVTIADATYFTTSAIWQLLPDGLTPTVALGTTRSQPIQPTGSVIEWGYVGEDNFGFFNLADPTNIVCSEPGKYHVHASLAWGYSLLGDHAATLLRINDQATPHIHWEFVRGEIFQAGFSQTVDVTAYVRLAKGDRLSVMAAHNGTAAQFTGYLKGSNVLTQASRLFMTFHSP